MKRILFFLCIPLVAQQPTTLGLSSPAPAAPNVSAFVVGNAGNSQYSYTVIANYPGGAVVSQPDLIQFVPTTLTATNYVTVSWNGLSGATSYDVVRVTPPTVFNGSCSICKVASGLTTTTINDTGAT